jgi:hypothetical protein
MPATRVRLHRYRVLSGPCAGMTSDGQQIGVQDRLNQIQELQQAGADSDQVMALIETLRKSLYEKGLTEGIWLNGPGCAVYRPLNRPPRVIITDEGVEYDGAYIDLCVPFDRNNREIFVGDILHAAVKNEVRQVEVKRIAAKPYMAGYGIMNRKLTVYDVAEDQTLTINDPRSTIKVWSQPPTDILE